MCRKHGRFFFDEWAENGDELKQKQSEVVYRG